MDIYLPKITSLFLVAPSRCLLAASAICTSVKYLRRNRTKLELRERERFRYLWECSREVSEVGIDVGTEAEVEELFLSVRDMDAGDWNRD